MEPGSYQQSARQYSPAIGKLADSLLLFAIHRVLLSVVGVVLFLAGLIPRTEDPLLRPYFGLVPVTEGLSGALLGVWLRFDAVHFIRIAQSGYSDPDLAPFYPLYPLLIRLFAWPSGENLLLAAIVASNLACLLSVVGFASWMRDEGYDAATTRRALLLFLWFPTAFFLFAPYSESTFVLFAILGLWAARRGRWAAAGLAGALAALTRLGGLALSLVVAFEWLRRRGSLPRAQSLAAAGAALAPLAAAAGLALWRSSVGLPNLIEVQEIYWRRVPAWPWSGIGSTIGRILARIALPVEFLDLIMVILMLALGVVILRWLPHSLGAYHWGLLLLGLAQMRIGQPLSGQARFALVLIPAYLALALTVHGSVKWRLVAYSFLILNVFLAGQFMLWGWVG